MSKQQNLAVADMQKDLDTVTTPKPLPTEQEKRDEFEDNLNARPDQEMNTDMNDVEAMKFNPDFRRLSDFLSLDVNNMTDYADKLSVLMGWAQEQSKSKDITDILGSVKGLQKGLGTQEIGLTGLNRLYQYIRLDMDSQRIQKEKALLKQ